MSFAFTMPTEVKERIKAVGFDPEALPHETVTHCDLCGTDRHQVVSWIDRYGFASRFVLCEACGLVFQSPRPTAEGYATFYERFYRPLVSARSGVLQTPKSLLGKQGDYAHTVIRQLNSSHLVRPGMRAVDVGGSTGVVAKALQDIGVSCLVVDPSPDELAIARSYGLETELSLAETWDVRGRQFDLALICQTVDHFISVRRSLEKLHSVLATPGLLFIDVVDFESSARCHEDYRAFLKIDHCYYLSDTTMRAYCASVGFEVVLADITQTHLSYICRRTDHKLPLDRAQMAAYAQSMSKMLRDRLVAPPARSYPVDPLTRLYRAVRRRIRH